MEEQVVLKRPSGDNRIDAPSQPLGEVLNLGQGLVPHEREAGRICYPSIQRFKHKRGHSDKRFGLEAHRPHGSGQVLWGPESQGPLQAQARLVSHWDLQAHLWREGFLLLPEGPEPGSRASGSANGLRGTMAPVPSPEHLAAR